MRFCFIIERDYKHERMPLAIADQLELWGHSIDFLEPQQTITSLSDLQAQHYDAYVLKTVSDGPGLIILEAAEAAGVPTINNSRSIRLVRDKAVAAALAHSHGLPIPPTYFVVYPRLLKQIPREEYPIVIKPTNGSSNRGIYRVNSPEELATLELPEARTSFFLAQHYVENPGFDIKLYVTGTEVFAVAKKSPLHPEVREGLMPVTPELRKLALKVGKVFGLDIYGLDVVETPNGLVLLDINDFPSFGQVPRAVSRIAEYILHAAKRAELKREARTKQQLRKQPQQAPLAESPRYGDQVSSVLPKKSVLPQR
jgi:ribosomal protein S6--L-glutamate ligase